VPEIPRTSNSAGDFEKPADIEHSPQSRDFTELEQENQLLKSEITSLTHELHLHAQRLQTSQQGINCVMLGIILNQLVCACVFFMRK
jgi:hypothetical protein